MLSVGGLLAKGSPYQQLSFLRLSGWALVRQGECLCMGQTAQLYSSVPGCALVVEPLWGQGMSDCEGPSSLAFAPLHFVCALLDLYWALARCQYNPSVAYA
jgi:hypothetical protein